MGKTGGDEDAESVGIRKKSKKSKKDKNIAVHDVNHGSVDESQDHVEVDGGLPKENGQKQWEQEIKSRSNEDGDKAQHDKGNLAGDGNVQKEKDKKKRKRDTAEGSHPFTEQEHASDDRGHSQGDCELDPRKEKKNKRRHKALEEKRGNDGDVSSIGLSGAEKRINDEVVEGKNSYKVITEMQNGEERTNKKRTKRAEKGNHAKGIELSKVNLEGENHESVGQKENKTGCYDSDTQVQGAFTKEPGKESSAQLDEGLASREIDVSSLKARNNGENSKRKKIKTKSVESNSEKPKVKGKSKRVSFSGHVEVFPSSAMDTEDQQTQKDDLVRGKRFTKEEDEIVKEAVLNYIEAHDLGENGLEKVMNCSTHGLKNCWKEIATCIPTRPYTAIYYRAHILFEGGTKGTWTPEETEILRKLHEKHGKDWKALAQELGKHRFHVKDKWRRIRYTNLKSGRWDQEEYQKLYNLVNLDLQMKAVSHERKSKHGMLRDNIPWGVISDKLSSRSDTSCCDKWYNQLTSSLVAEGKWSDVDDYLLIGALYDLDAACVEDVNWDNLLEHRSGDICRKRWNQMVLHIGHHNSKPFAEQVEILAQRYSPDLAETREAWDNKPVIP